MPKLISSLLLSLSLSFSLSACTLKVPDVPLCTELNITKGFCTSTVSDKDITIDEKHPYSFDGSKPQTWFEMRTSLISFPASSWAELKKFILKACKLTGKCDEMVASWDRKLQKLDEMTTDKSSLSKPKAVQGGK